MVEPVSVIRPGAVWMRVVGVTRPVSSAQCGDEGLHRRARLEGVGERAVAHLRAGQVLAVVGRVAREVGEREHFAALRVEDDDAARLGLVGGDRVADALVGEELHLRVDRQADVLAVERGHAVADVLDDAAEPVLDDAARAVAAGELLLERELDAFLAVVLDVGEADDVRGGLAFRVLALVLAHLVDALERGRSTPWRRSSSTWRRSQTKFGLSAEAARSSAARVMPSRRASRARLAASPSRSFGIAQIDGAGTLAARIRPLRSRMRPRLAGSSMVWP